MTRVGEVRVADGTTISYAVTGSGPWLVLSNSLATNRHMWDPQLEELAARFTVLTYDTRGHGKSGVGDGDFDFTTLAGDVVALMDELGIDTARFMGLSLGGMTGLALALEHPGRFDRVTCCDARADAPDGYRAMWDANIALAEADGMAAVAEATLPRWFSDSYREDPANAPSLESVREMILTTDAKGYILAARCLQGLDYLKSLDQIQIPAQFITGELDPAASVAVMQDMADRVPNAKLHVVPGAAHLSNLERPTAFLEAALTTLA